MTDTRLEAGPALTRDALNRAWRTLLQGVAVVALAVLAAVARVVYDALTGAGWDPVAVDWQAVAISARTAATMAVAALVWRRFLDPTRIPSAQPPTDRDLGAGEELRP